MARTIGKGAGSRQSREHGPPIAGSSESLSFVEGAHEAGDHVEGSKCQRVEESRSPCVRTEDAPVERP
jgi:hypothetical protein